METMHCSVCGAELVHGEMVHSLSGWITVWTCPDVTCGVHAEKGYWVNDGSYCYRLRTQPRTVFIDNLHAAIPSKAREAEAHWVSCEASNQQQVWRLPFTKLRLICICVRRFDVYGKKLPLRTAYWAVCYGNKKLFEMHKKH